MMTVAEVRKHLRNSKCIAGPNPAGCFGTGKNIVLRPAVFEKGKPLYCVVGEKSAVMDRWWFPYVGQRLEVKGNDSWGMPSTVYIYPMSKLATAFKKYNSLNAVIEERNTQFQKEYEANCLKLASSDTNVFMEGVLGTMDF